MPIKLTDAEILEKIIFELHTNKHTFAKKLGYSHGAFIYQVTKGEKAFPDKLKTKILAMYPEVNVDFIENGIGPVLMQKYSEKQAMNNLNKVADLHETIESRLDKLKDRLELMEVQQRIIMSKLNTIVNLLSHK